MKKTILISLSGLYFLLVGCAAPANINRNVNIKPAAIEITNGWLTYNDNGFEMKYPEYLTTAVEQVGVGTTVSFSGTKTPSSNYESLLSVTFAPNQGGITLEEWSNEKVSQGKEKVGELTISELKAHKLILPESDAGPYYIFISETIGSERAGRTMYEIFIQAFDQAESDRILSSFQLTEG